jgi:hypothetical protein
VHLPGHRRGGHSSADPAAETSDQCAKGGHPTVIVTRPRLTYLLMLVSCRALVRPAVRFRETRVRHG